MILVLIFYFILSLAAAKSPRQEIALANKLFTEKFYKQLTKIQNGSFLVSPFSTQTILAFVLIGSRGDTAKELRKGLNLPEDRYIVEAGIREIFGRFESNSLYDLITANIVYVKKNFTVHNQFKNGGRRIYEAETESIDFVPNGAKAARAMNGWIGKKTLNKIKDLVQYSDFTRNTMVVLLNALYFKANFLDAFGISNTKKIKFYKNANEMVYIDALNHYNKNFNYYNSSTLKAQFLELPFMGDDASMIFVLPHTVGGLPSIENQLDKVFARKRQLKMELLDVTLPKFKFETLIDCRKILEGLGIKKIFQKNVADLSHIAGKPRQLYVYKVAQKAVIEVNEKGIEAGEPTNIFAGFLTRFGRTAEKSFNADHPFLFYIVVKNVIILIGKVINP